MESRRGRPTKAYLSTLKRATSDDYQKLVRGAVEALISGSTDVLISFPYVFKFPEDFPKGILVEQTETTNVRRIKAKKLLAWLRERGHTDITTEALRAAQISFTRTHLMDEGE